MVKFDLRIGYVCCFIMEADGICRLSFPLFLFRFYIETSFLVFMLVVGATTHQRFIML